jgi:hypothetical protein
MRAKGERNKMWRYGIINGFEYEVKVYDTGSQYGINGGRISKLWLRGPEGRANYDRGWDIEPTTPEAEKAVQEILKRFE